jgi:hypothetical protein
MSSGMRAFRRPNSRPADPIGVDIPCAQLSSGHANVSPFKCPWGGARQFWDGIFGEPTETTDIVTLISGHGGT